MDWGKISEWGEMARLKISEAADKAQLKIEEAKYRLEPPVEVSIICNLMKTTANADENSIR